MNKATLIGIVGCLALTSACSTVGNKNPLPDVWYDTYALRFAGYDACFEHNFITAKEYADFKYANQSALNTWGYVDRQLLASKKAGYAEALKTSPEHPNQSFCDQGKATGYTTMKEMEEYKQRQREQYERAKADREYRDNALKDFNKSMQEFNKSMQQMNQQNGAQRRCPYPNMTVC